MTAQTLKRSPESRLQTTPPTARYDQPDRLSLRTDLYLIAHDDTGRPHLDKRSRATGLAGAVLLELWLARHIRIGWQDNPRHGTWQRNPGHITLLNATPTGDPITDAALTLLHNMGGSPAITDFVRRFATPGLYERVRGHLTTTGTLRTTTRRRLRFFRTQTHPPSHAGYPVRARTRVRDVTRLFRPNPYDIALAGLVTALGLTPYLNLPDNSPTRLHLRLAELIGPQHPVHDVTTAINQPGPTPRQTMTRTRPLQCGDSSERTRHRLALSTPRTWRTSPSRTLTLLMSCYRRHSTVRERQRASMIRPRIWQWRWGP
jgi:hypothetical protein